MIEFRPSLPIGPADGEAAEANSGGDEAGGTTFRQILDGSMTSHPVSGISRRHDEGESSGGGAYPGPWPMLEKLQSQIGYHPVVADEEDAAPESPSAGLQAAPAPPRLGLDAAIENTHAPVTAPSDGLQAQPAPPVLGPERSTPEADPLLAERGAADPATPAPSPPESEARSRLQPVPATGSPVVAGPASPVHDAGALVAYETPPVRSIPRDPVGPESASPPGPRPAQQPITADAPLPVTAPAPNTASTAPVATPASSDGDAPHVDPAVTRVDRTARPVPTEPVSLPDPVRPATEVPAPRVVAAPVATAPSSAAAPQATAAVDRIVRIVEWQQHQPPPRSMVVEVPELDGLRMRVSLRGAEVAITPTHQDGMAALRPLQSALDAALSARGFALSFSADGEAGGRRPRPEVPDEPRPRSTPRRRPVQPEDGLLI